MRRWSASLIYPLTACIVGVAAAFAFAAINAPIWASFAIGLSMTVGALSLRNWWIGEEERPLLAEELLGLHEAVDSLRAEASELREMMSEAVEIAEYCIAEDAGAPGAQPITGLDLAARISRSAASFEDVRSSGAEKDAKIAKLEERIAELEERAENDAPAETPFVDRFEERLEAHEARTRKLMHALAIAIKATGRHAERLRQLEAEHEWALDEEEDALSIDEDRLPDEVDKSVASPWPSAPSLSDPSAMTTVTVAKPGRVKAPSPLAGTADQGKSQRNDKLVAAPPLPSFGSPKAKSEPTPAPKTRAPSAPAEPEGRSQAASADITEALLNVQPIFRAENNEIRLLEVIGEGATEEDFQAGALLDRAIALAARFRMQEREIGVLFNIGLNALRSDTTFSALLTRLRADPAAARLLAPALPQSEVAQLSHKDFALMRRLSDMGVRFALRDVDPATLDQKRAADAGVRLILLSADQGVEREERSPGALKRMAHSLAQHAVTLALIDVEEPHQADVAASAPGVLAQGDAIAAPRTISLH